MKLAPIMSANASAFAFRVDDLPSLTDFCRRFGQRIIAVDGFAGVGKTTLAQGLARELGTTLVSLDDYLPGDPEAMNVQSYVSRLDRDRLRRALAGAANAVVEGALLRDAIDGMVARSEMAAIYLALCSNPVPDKVIWHDGIRIEEGDEDGADWFTRSETAYHRRVRPHDDTDAIALRIE